MRQIWPAASALIMMFAAAACGGSDPAPVAAEQDAFDDDDGAVDVPAEDGSADELETEVDELERSTGEGAVTSADNTQGHLGGSFEVETADGFTYTAEYQVTLEHPAQLEFGDLPPGQTWLEVPASGWATIQNTTAGRILPRDALPSTTEFADQRYYETVQLMLPSSAVGGDTSSCGEYCVVSTLMSEQIGDPAVPADGSTTATLLFRPHSSSGVWHTRSPHDEDLAEALLAALESGATPSIGVIVWAEGAIVGGCSGDVVAYAGSYYGGLSAERAC